MNARKSKRNRYIRRFVSVVVLVSLGLVTAFIGNVRYQAWAYNSMINSAEYQSAYGKWNVIELPDGVALNTIHTVVLPTGKLLLIAGSGNDVMQSLAGTFRTLVYDPVSGQTREIPTPSDVFCAGIAFLPNGNLLVAGGTLRYEVLEEDVTNAGGVMTIRNEDPNKEQRLPRGTTFVGRASGNAFRIDTDVLLYPAVKTESEDGTVTITASEKIVFAQAVEPGEGSVIRDSDHYVVQGFPEEDTNNVYGLSREMTLDKQNYQGAPESYEFNPWTEAYEQVDDLSRGRWYPTLTSLPDGRVLALSGLDQAGQIIDGQTEVYEPTTKQWTDDPKLQQYFKTYPAVFQTAVPGLLFYSGSSTGYGPEEKQRDPGLWNLENNTFTTVPGIEDPDMLETSSSTWAGDVADQRMIVVGGGGVGESTRSTGRIGVVDLNNPSPRFVAGPSLPQGTRYPNLVNMPDGRVFITGGSSDYRGKGDSDILASYFFDPKAPLSQPLSPAASQSIGRNYHGGAVLLPDGQIMVVGGDPLFSDELNTKAGMFERRLEIFTPPYLLPADGRPVVRPTIVDGPDQLIRGSSFDYTIGSSTPAGQAPTISSARLMLPSAVTHATDTNRRSVELDVAQQGDVLTVNLPAEPTLVPPGYYMLFVNNDAGVPSIAKWVRVQ